MNSGIESERKTVVLGAGVTGLMAAWELSKSLGDKVLVVERSTEVGGLAASVNYGGHTFDLGSHRIHSELPLEMLDRIRDLSGGELLKRVREGQIFIRGRFLRYPPNLLDVVQAYGATSVSRLLLGFFGAQLRPSRRSPEPSTFESYAISQVGRPLYEMFYKPYALKLWNMPPTEISDEPARKRVRRNFVRNFKRNLYKKKKHYFYPANGIGQISKTLSERARANGAEIALGSRLAEFEFEADGKIDAVTIASCSGEVRRVLVDRLVSTIPMEPLHRALAVKSESPPFSLQWRGLRIVFFILRDDHTTPCETLYFPSEEILFGRVSEIGKYSPHLAPRAGFRTLTLEIPCTRGDATWNMPLDELTQRCLSDLRQLGLIEARTTQVEACESICLDHIYPIYTLDWRRNYQEVLSFFSSFPNLYVVGRTALFLHCNIDHCLMMGEKVAQAVEDRACSAANWHKQLPEFLKNYYVRE